MNRWLALVAAGAIVLSPSSAHAASCSLAKDPSGDATTGNPAGISNAEHDIRELALDVRPDRFRFHITLEKVSTTAPLPGFGDRWTVRLTTSRGSDMALWIVRTWQKEEAYVLLGDRRYSYLDYEFDPARSTVTVEMRHAQGNITRGEQLVVRSAEAGPLVGIFTGSEDASYTGTAGYSDRVELTRKVVAGRRCG